MIDQTKQKGNLLHLYIRVDIIEAISNVFEFLLVESGLNNWICCGSNRTPTLFAGAGEGELKLGYKLETFSLGYKNID